MIPSFRTAIRLAALAFLVPAAQATIITPTAATSSAGNLSNRPIEDAIDGTGLSSGGASGDILTETHVVSADNAGPYFLGALGSVLTFDLGGTHTVNTVHLWTYSRTGETDRGISSFDISFSTDGGSNFNVLPTLSVTGIIVGDYPNPIAVQSFGFSEQTGVTDIRLDNIVNHGDNNYTGLSEIRFGQTVIPEPGSLALLVSGVLTLRLLGLRRRA